jgi:hypothetical protein
MTGPLRCKLFGHRRRVRIVQLHPVLSYLYCKRRACTWTSS